MATLYESCSYLGGYAEMAHFQIKFVCVVFVLLGENVLAKIIMGIKVLMLMGLLIGVLYGLHLLAQDYQAITAPKLLRLLFKRDITSITNNTATVRWRKILHYDPIQCARLVYCDLGAHLPDNELRRGFTYMLALDTKEEDKAAMEEFKTAYFHGRALRSNPELCSEKYPTCPFKAKLLFDLLYYLLHKKL